MKQWEQACRFSSCRTDKAEDDSSSEHRPQEAWDNQHPVKREA